MTVLGQVLFFLSFFFFFTRGNSLWMPILSPELHPFPSASSL